MHIFLCKLPITNFMFITNFIKNISTDWIIFAESVEILVV